MHLESSLYERLLEEVQRRKVYRVAAAYVVAAGFMIQIASAAFPAWELPNWSLRLVIALLLIGFPIALILAWAYDMTPQGIRAAVEDPSGKRRRNVIALIATGVRFQPLPDTSCSPVRRSPKSASRSPFCLFKI